MCGRCCNRGGAGAKDGCENVRKKTSDAIEVDGEEIYCRECGRFYKAKYQPFGPLDIYWFI